MLRSGRLRQTGAAMVEFYIVALLAVLPLCLGMIQLALLLEENHHIDHAAFHATRMAAMASGDTGVARRNFARAATLLSIDASSPVTASNVVARTTAAYARTLADTARFARIIVVSPDQDARHDFAIVRSGQRVIPNDALAYRSTARGPRSGITLQEANILQIEFTWCRPLVVPFARQLLLGLVRRIDNDPFNQYCYLQERIPIRSTGSSPMQSDFRVTS